MASSSAIRVAPDECHRFARDAFASAGLPEDHAETVAGVLTFASRRGLDTHGVMRVPAYLKRIRAGAIATDPKITVDRRTAVTAVVDGGNAMGPVVAAEAMEACIAAAEAHGVGVVTARHSNHFGAASAFTVPAAERGFIAMAMSVGARSLAPFGSRAPLFGTNPIAMAAPAGRHAPWSLDMAASVASRGRIRVAEREGQPIPEGWALDADGRPTTDPTAALEGVVLPFAGPKGSGLSMMVDVLAGVLAGAGFAGTTLDWNRDYSGAADVGHFFLAVRVDALMAPAAFAERMETAIARLKALPPAEGFAEVLYPGERGARRAAERERDGVPIGAATYGDLAALAASLRIAPPKPL